VHTYSGLPDAPGRIDSVAHAMAVLGGMAQAGHGAATLQFPCGADHEVACKRVFLEACKPEPGKPIAARGLSIADAKAGCTIDVVPLGNGRYELRGERSDEGVAARIAAIAAGFVKLARMSTVNDMPGRIVFDCGHGHDELMALLLPRAINVRAALREQEATAGRGILVAPSAQKT
jgi:hypothetical protein